MQMKNVVVISIDHNIPVISTLKNDIPPMVKKGLPYFLVNQFLDAVIGPTEIHFGR